MTSVEVYRFWIGMISVCTKYLYSIFKKKRSEGQCKGDKQSEMEGRDLSDQEHTNQDHRYDKDKHDDMMVIYFPVLNNWFCAKYIPIK